MFLLRYEKDAQLGKRGDRSWERDGGPDKYGSLWLRIRPNVREQAHSWKSNSRKQPSHRRRIAVSHRRRIASLHEMQGTSLKLHPPVVQPTRCTRTKDVDPEQRVLGGASTRTHRSHGRKVVTRWSSKSYARCTVCRPMRSKELMHCTAKSITFIFCFCLKQAV